MLTLAPTSSNTRFTSSDECRAVPLKTMCSRKWLTPEMASVSSREPVRTKKPRATDRADRLVGSRPAMEAMSTLGDALAEDFGDEVGADIGFHLADWNSDAAFIVAVHLFPERFTAEEIRDLVRSRLGEDLGPVVSMEPLQRGPSGRIVRLRIQGKDRSLIVGKELEIRRALSRSHLYSSAFDVERQGAIFVLKGKGCGHGVGLCQIGAAVMASRGKSYQEILRHYYPGASTQQLPG